MDPELAPCLQFAASGSGEARCQAEGQGDLELRVCRVFQAYQVGLHLQLVHPVARVPLVGSRQVAGWSFPTGTKNLMK